MCWNPEKEKPLKDFKEKAIKEKDNLHFTKMGLEPEGSGTLESKKGQRTDVTDTEWLSPGNGIWVGKG